MSAEKWSLQVLSYLHLMATTNDPAQVIVHFSVFPVHEISKSRYS